MAALRQRPARPDRLHSEPMSAGGAPDPVVEDEDTIREMVCLALGKEGYRTEAFDDGARAWESLARALPDLVILDIGLPRLDGLEICRGSARDRRRCRSSL